ncbi:protein containing Excisionase/Xis, DNA-binding domain protein [Rhodopirellula baltica SH28]|uniref:Protein containing Excisionase/Xis, DNA-binding domain protein n=1 Tax=Rhodopirellula baltica SH28 TaxID=993517 RepID=K5D862_RHOBT|nr:helix-turn-helix domain-containing protein [Rhodopirellula baltica]EKK02932.1 protein containing Excisionase/Xis, DNA-binding domain protein [Rhodopirellula baltica SH28]
MTLYTVKEAAEFLKVSPSLVYQITQRGDLPSYQIGSCRRISEADLLEYLESRRKEPLPKPQSNTVHF